MCVHMLPVTEKDLLSLIEAFGSLPGAFRNNQMYQVDHLQFLPLVQTAGRGQGTVRIM